MIAENLNKIKAQLGSNIKLIVVTKTRSIEEIMQVYEAGHKIFGENRVQELCEKQKLLPNDIEWHLIGHLQTNKVKYIAPFIDTIHSVDSFKLLQVINKEAAKNNRVINCLLQGYVAKEETKFGMLFEEIEALLLEPTLQELKNIKITGLMGMATNTNNEEQVATEFGTLKKWFEKLKEIYFKNNNDFKELSMGMSGDYLFAAANGSTMVRIGSLIFS